MARYKDLACEYAHKWLDAIERHYGVKPILYTYDSYYNNYLKGKGFDDYDFFIARYHEDYPRVPHLEIWQYTEKDEPEGSPLLLTSIYSWVIIRNSNPIWIRIRYRQSQLVLYRSS